MKRIILSALATITTLIPTQAQANEGMKCLNQVYEQATTLAGHEPTNSASLWDEPNNTLWVWVSQKDTLITGFQHEIAFKFSCVNGIAKHDYTVKRTFSTVFDGNQYSYASGWNSGVIDKEMYWLLGNIETAISIFKEQ